MGSVNGLGGVFLRAADPKGLYAWYEEHLGLKRGEGGAFAFFSQGPREMTLLAFFPQDTKYFGPGQQQAMLNLRVEDMDAMVAKLRSAGVEVEHSPENFDYGKFAWFHDPAGNRVELWQATD